MNQVIVTRTGTREKLHFGDWTERYTVPTHTCWDGGVEWLADGEAPGPVVTPDAETAVAIKRFRDAAKWISERLWANRPDFMFQEGDEVEAYKGRKVPTGVYQFVSMGDSRFGKVVRLTRSGFSAAVEVSWDHVRRVVKKQKWDDMIVGIFGGHSGYLTAQDYPTTEHANGLGALADALEEGGHVEQAGVLRRWAESCTRRALERAESYRRV